MYTVEAIKNAITKLYNEAPLIHLNVSLIRPRLYLENEEATIVGAYPHIFRIEECSSGKIQRHTLQYSDVLTKHVEIIELNGK